MRKHFSPTDCTIYKHEYKGYMHVFNIKRKIVLVFSAIHPISCSSGHNLGSCSPTLVMFSVPRGLVYHQSMNKRELHYLQAESLRTNKQFTTLAFLF